MSADVLIASDGPRLASGSFDDLSRLARSVQLRPRRRAARRRASFGQLGRACSPIPEPYWPAPSRPWSTRRGRILVDALRPAPIPDSVRRALADIEPGEPGGPAIDADWGEPGLSPAERVFGWNALEVLAFRTGNPEHPVNAIPPRASAHMQLRFVAGCDSRTFIPALRAHLDGCGFSVVAVRQASMEPMAATRLDPENPWVRWASASIAATTGAPPAILPNLGGSLPNDCFADVLGLPTIWVPHSYPGCSQHAPDEHMLARIAREGLQIMTGLFWDLGASGTPARVRSHGPARSV